MVGIWFFEFLRESGLGLGAAVLWPHKHMGVVPDL